MLVALAASACAGGSRGRAENAPTSRVAPVTTGVGSRTQPGSRAHRLSQRYEPPLPIAIQEAAAAVSANRLYVIGGYDASGNSSTAVFEFDGRSWQGGPALPIALNHPGAAAIGGAVYVAGGFTPSGATNRAFVLNPGARNWCELPSMQRPRGALALLAVDRRLYAIGGRDGTNQVAVPESYEPKTQTWTDLPAMPEPRNHVAGYLDQGRACVAGGRTPDTSDAIDCVTPGVAAWHSRGTLAVPTSGAAAGVLDGVTVVARGEPDNETSLVGVVQLLNHGIWTTNPMLVPRHGTAYAIYRQRLWACGGATAPGFHAVSTCTSLTV
jgi:hypothetical protein